MVDAAAVPLRLVAAVSGDMTGLVTLPDGRQVWLHSTRDPRAEGERLAATVPPEAPLVLVAGLGLGYHVAALRRRLPRARLYIIEPDRELIAHAARLGVFRADAAASILTGSEAEMLAALQRLSAELADRAAVLIHTPSLLRLRIGHQRLAELLEVVLMQRNSTVRQGEFVPENIARNRTLAERDPDALALGGKLAGGFPTLVAAGPTLDHARPFLRRYRARLKIVAVDTALAALLADGIEPEIVVAIDPFPANALHFTATGSACTLVYAPAVYHAIPGLFPAQRRAVLVPQAHMQYQALRDYWGARPVITGGSTVAVVALELLQLLGESGPLFMAGADFGFPFGSVYARGTRFQRLAALGAARFATIENTNYRAIHGATLLAAQNAAGECVATHKNYFSFRQECEAFIARAPRFRYVQLAGHGLAIKGVEQMTIAQAAALVQ